ncbi:MAG: serine/threonine-protein kinase, partial [Myxococcota bacterium]
MAIPELEAGYVIAERYRVERKLGEGGMGHVYLVVHLSTEERFALKILDPQVANTESAQERFRREARAPARINSDHVCRVVDNDIAVELGGAPFLVMEYLEGDDLEVITYHRGALPPIEVITYLRHVARGLDKAHAIGIIHRDLKPDNVVVTMRDDG